MKVIVLQMHSLAFNRTVQSGAFYSKILPRRWPAIPLRSIAAGEIGYWAVALRAPIRGTIRQDYSTYGKSVERLVHG